MGPEWAWYGPQVPCPQRWYRLCPSTETLRLVVVLCGSEKLKPAHLESARPGTERWDVPCHLCDAQQLVPTLILPCQIVFSCGLAWKEREGRFTRPSDAELGRWCPSKRVPVFWCSEQLPVYTRFRRVSTPVDQDSAILNLAVLSASFWANRKKIKPRGPRAKEY